MGFSVNTNGDTQIWNSKGPGGFSNQDLGVVPTSYQIARTGDFNADGEAASCDATSTGTHPDLEPEWLGGFTEQDLGRFDRLPASTMFVEPALLYEDNMLPGRPLRMFSSHEGKKTDSYQENIPTNETKILAICLHGSLRRDYSLCAEKSALGGNANGSTQFSAFGRRCGCVIGRRSPSARADQRSGPAGHNAARARLERSLDGDLSRSRLRSLRPALRQIQRRHGWPGARVDRRCLDRGAGMVRRPATSHLQRHPQRPADGVQRRQWPHACVPSAIEFHQRQHPRPPGPLGLLRTGHAPRHPHRV